MKERLETGKAFPLVNDGSSLIDALIAAGNFSNHNTNVCGQNFPASDKLTFVKIYKYNVEISDQQALADMKKNGDQPAGLLELLLFKLLYSDVAGKIKLLLALNSNWHDKDGRAYPCLTRPEKGKKAELELDWYDFTWDEGASFLAICQTPYDWHVDKDNEIGYMEMPIRLNGSNCLNNNFLINRLRRFTSVSQGVEEILFLNKIEPLVGKFKVVILRNDSKFYKSIGNNNFFYGVLDFAESLGLVMPDVQCIGELIKMIDKVGMIKMGFGRIAVMHWPTRISDKSRKTLCLYRPIIGSVPDIIDLPFEDLSGWDNIGFLFLKRIE